MLEGSRQDTPINSNNTTTASKDNTESASLEICNNTSSLTTHNYSMDTTTANSNDDEDNSNMQNNHFEEERVTTTNNYLGLFPLIAIIFYNVSGGPFGLEEAIRSGGAFYTLLGFLVFPFVWSLQESLITAELSCAFPDASGGVAWVDEAFGKTAGFMVGYLEWISGATDNAIYPVLFLDYVLQIWQPTAATSDDNTTNDDEAAFLDPWLRFCLITSTTIGLAYVNWLGLELVGTMSLAICVLAMSPFLLLIFVGAFQVQPSRWLELPSPLSQDDLETYYKDDIAGGFFPNLVVGGVLLRPFLNNLFWNLNSYDSAASYSEEVHPGDLARVFPKAMMGAVVMVSLGYLLPLLILLGVEEDDDTTTNTTNGGRGWPDGYIAVKTQEIVFGSPWIGAWVIFAAGISNLGLFQAELSSDAFQLMGMAKRGHLPECFAHKSRHGTPTYAILLGTAVIVVLGVSNLDQLIEMLNFNYSIALLMEYMAFLKLRISQPDVPRPFRIPLNTTGCIIALIPTIGATLMIIVLASFETYVVCVCANLVGYLIYTRNDYYSLYRYYTRVSSEESMQQQQQHDHQQPEPQEGQTTNVAIEPIT